MRLLILAPALLLACPPPQPSPDTSDASDVTVVTTDATPAPPPPSVPDSAPAPAQDSGPPPDAYALACQNLAKIGCPEGTRPNCADVLRHVQDAGLTKLNIACLTIAPSTTAAIACGSVKCK